MGFDHSQVWARISLYVLLGLGVLAVGWYAARSGALVETPLGENVWLSDDGTWQPTAEEIRQFLKQRSYSNESEALDEFLRLFKMRYRAQAMAVSCKAIEEEDGTKAIKLSCAATMPRWYVARIARNLWNESRATLGKTYPIHIYETYVFQASRFIGKCTPSPTRPEQAEILFD